MTGLDWLSGYLARLGDEHVVARRADAARLAPAHCLLLDAEDWGNAARVAAESGYRWAGVWGDPVAEHVVVHACLVYGGDYLVLEIGRAHV